MEPAFFYHLLDNPAGTNPEHLESGLHVYALFIIRPILILSSHLLQWVSVLFPGGTAAEAWLWPPTPSNTEVKERVEVYRYFPSGASWPIVGWTVPASHLLCIPRCLLVKFHLPRLFMSSSWHPFYLYEHPIFLNLITVCVESTNHSSSFSLCSFICSVVNPSMLCPNFQLFTLLYCM